VLGALDSCASSPPGPLCDPESSCSAPSGDSIASLDRSSPDSFSEGSSDSFASGNSVASGDSVALVEALEARGSHTKDPAEAQTDRTEIARLLSVVVGDLDGSVKAYRRVVDLYGAEDVIVDELDGSQAIGRSMADAPEIDGRVYLPASNGAKKIKSGTIVTARVTNADEYDLWAEPVG